MSEENKSISFWADFRHGDYHDYNIDTEMMWGIETDSDEFNFDSHYFLLCPESNPYVAKAIAEVLEENQDQLIEAMGEHKKIESEGFEIPDGD